MYGCVMSLVRMRHVKCMNESCHTYEWVMSHVRLCYVARTNVSCHRCERNAYCNTHTIRTRMTRHACTPTSQRQLCADSLSLTHSHTHAHSHILQHTYTAHAHVHAHVHAYVHARVHAHTHIATDTATHTRYAQEWRGTRAPPSSQRRLCADSLSLFLILFLALCLSLSFFLSFSLSFLSLSPLHTRTMYEGDVEARVHHQTANDDCAQTLSLFSLSLSLFLSLSLSRSFSFSL